MSVTAFTLIDAPHAAPPGGRTTTATTNSNTSSQPQQFRLTYRGGKQLNETTHDSTMAEKRRITIWPGMY